MNKEVVKWLLALAMWGLGTFDIFYLGLHLGIEQYSIIGNIWIVGACLMAWMPNKND
jgi:hypothetical protein